MPNSDRAPVSTHLEFTGERFVPGAVPRHLAPRIHLEHVHRYAFAASLARGRVLDLGCGAGYGSQILAAGSECVVGLDFDPRVLRFSAERFAVEGSVSFVAGDATTLPFAASCFDTVVCFEAIEHVRDGEQLVAEAARVLRPNGRFLVSSPVGSEHRRTYPSHSNPFHVHEYEVDELQTMLSRHFPAVRMLGQRLVAASWIWMLPGRFGGPLEAAETPANDALAPTGLPLYALAVCSRSASVTEIPAPSLLPGRLEEVLDGLVDAICARYESQIAELNRAASARDERSTAEIDRLRHELEASGWRRLRRVIARFRRPRGR
jgi:SAM-dependent methyltransferase